MVDREQIMARVRQQAEKKWDTESIANCLSKLSKDGIPSKGIAPLEAAGHKQEVLDLVQRRAEDYTFFGRI